MKDFACTDLDRALGKIISGVPHPIDVLQVNFNDTYRFAVNMVGFGLPAKINEMADGLRIFKKQRYNLASVLGIIFHKPHVLKVLVEGSDASQNVDFILGANTKHVGSGLKIAPHASLCDGLVDLIVLRPANRRALAGLFIQLMKGTHLQHPLVQYCAIKQFSVIAKRDSLLNIDGESYRFSSANIEVIPKGIDLLV